MNNRGIFIEMTKSLFASGARKVTTDPFKAGEGNEFAIPINDLVIIDGHCNSKTILEHNDTTKYVIVSDNKFIFNGLEYATIYTIEESPGKSAKLYTALSNAETLALHCEPNPTPVLPIGGDANFISSPSDFHMTRYAKTKQEGVYLRQDLNLDITSKLSVSIKDSKIIVTPKTTQPSQ